MDNKSVVRRKAETSLKMGSVDDTENCDSDKESLISPLLKRIFEQRGLTELSETRYPLKNLLPPHGLKNASESTALLADAVEAQKRLLILGDYDTDGATATVVAILCLRSMGVNQIDYLVPNRFEYGYGLSPEIASVAVNKQPDLVITVDNGINSLEGVDVLKKNGISVLITDHHLAGDVLPNADSILNPNQPGDTFGSKMLAGVGVMFYLLLLLRSELKSRGWFEDRNITIPNLAEYLDLVALGTVADVVPMDYNNRILVAQGLARIRAGRCRLGIMALLEVANKHYHNAVSSDFGFVLAPRLNAAGRLDDISTGIECLLSDNSSTARKLADELNEINLQRRAIEQQMQTQALEIVNFELEKQKENKQPANSQGYCLYNPDWHQGITGLVASRIKDKVNQPVVAFARTEQGTLSGSVRSVNGLHIKDLLERIAVGSPDLMHKFGGHAMAAGLTIDEGKIDEFKLAYQYQVSVFYAETEINDAIYSDGELDEFEYTLDTALELRDAAPWGQGFPAPQFDGKFIVIEQRVVGGQHLKMKLQPLGSEQIIDGIAFKALEVDENPDHLNTITAVYQLDINEFRGKRSLQLLIHYFESI